MSPLLDTTLLTVYSPLSRAPSQVGLELVVLAGAVATFVHARRANKKGDPAALLTWLAILVYGIAMEIVSYHFVDNFTHAQFTVMLYHHKLPLYVTALYPVLLYTGIATARWLQLPRAIEPLAAGLFIVAMDVPFDLMGPVAGWWSWSDADPNLAVRWGGVPVTSFFWHLTFGGSLALLSRALGPAAARRGPAGLLLALPIALGTMVCGFLLFLPFHGLKHLGVNDGLIVGAALALCALATALSRRAPRQGTDRLLWGVPALFVCYHLALALAS